MRRDSFLNANSSDKNEKLHQPADSTKLRVTYKTTLAQPKPYNTRSSDEYIEYLIRQKDNLFIGNVGVYPARELDIDGQKVYFLFLDIDGDRNLSEDEKIESAIINAQITWQSLKQLGAEHYFRFIATGGTGFRAVSNKYLNRAAYDAFVYLVKSEMPHIHDLQPTEDTEFPYQLFVYKGNHRQNEKDPVDRHSMVIPGHLLDSGVLTVSVYKRLTDGKLEPDESIQFVKWLLNGTAITDLSALGGFGEKLEQYQQVSSDLQLDPFEYNRMRKQSCPLAVEVLHEMLAEKGIVSEIKHRGNSIAISFQSLPCPLCGKRSSNARAYPPSYTLRCFNTNCPAFEGMPLHVWAGIKTPDRYPKNSVKAFDLRPPAKFVELKQGRETIRAELTDGDDALIVVTPGVGKTYEALGVISEMTKQKTVIYSSFNKDLQREAYNIAKTMAGDSTFLHRLQPRDELCLKKEALREVTLKGYSPAEVLCRQCEFFESTCSYYRQRKEIGPGAYFVTHHMLKYLENRIPHPDLIVLDENLKAGFMLEDTCSEAQMRSLFAVLNGQNTAIINNILMLGQQVATVAVRERRDQFINGRNLTEADLAYSTVIDLLAKRMNIPEKRAVEELKALISSIENRPKLQLYHDQLNLKAIRWFKGLCQGHAVSFILAKTDGSASYNTKFITPLRFPETPIKVLDATGDAAAAKSLIGKTVKTVQADVEWSSKRIHFQISTGRSALKQMRENNLENLLSEMVSRTDATNVMVITYKFAEKRVLSLLNKIDSSRTFKSYHFFGPRGINTFQDCNAVLVLGLPYSNLNSCAQDACILFPKENDDDKRVEWPEANMQWELLQNIHRIRPVNKPKVDIVIAARHWPSILPTPDHVIDKSRSKNRQEEAIARLTPFVEEFGFFNPDICYVANVMIKSKRNVAEKFLRKLNMLLMTYFLVNKPKKVDSRSSIFLDKEKLFTNSHCSLNSGLLELNNFDVTLKDQRSKWFLLIYYYISKIHLNPKNNLTSRLINLYDQVIGTKTNDVLKLSNKNQFAGIKNHFQQLYSHFQKFKIKLPHSRNNYVSGVGDPQRLAEFYTQLNDYQIFGKIDVDSLVVTAQSLLSIDPIPEGYVSVYVPTDNNELLYVGYRDEFKIISDRHGPNELLNYFEPLASGSGTTIITNNGKDLAKKLLSCGLAKLKLNDVIINEKLIATGEVPYRALNLKTVLKRNGLSKGLERSAVVRQLVDVWLRQQPVIGKLGLEKVFDLEQALIWVTAKIEGAGMPVDVDSMLSYQYSCKKSERDYSVIDDYIELIGSDDRLRDSIEQLNTKTGRFYRRLQTVRREGPMRSFFKPRAGYKFIVADYSQQEARVTAGLANDQAALKIFHAGKDFYLEVARELRGGSRSEYRKFRKAAKTIVLGLFNGMSQYGIYQELMRSGLRQYDLDDVSRFVFQYNNLIFTGISNWQDHIIKQAQKDGYVTSRLGRRLSVSDGVNPNSILNFPVQATAADGFKLALLNLDRALEGVDAGIINILHDEVIVEVREDIADRIAVIVKNCMESAYEEMLPGVPFVAEPEIKQAWGVPI